ncbi:MAG: 50S ribosomal protein L31 [Gammaproteobacteria bacterium]|nr:50S ribosomal protein L31 [Gammaproteobacteria bacterium]
MQTDIHPNYQDIKVVCSCGHNFVTRSTSKDELHLDICNECHPFFTGQQKMIDTAGRVERFRKKYAARGKAKPADKKEDDS